MNPEMFAAIDATWPAAAQHRAGAFMVREGQGGGKRVSAASLAGDWSEADIKAAIARQNQLRQTAVFLIRPGEEKLDAALAARGFDIIDPVVILAAPVAQIATVSPPPVTAYCLWPPLSIMRELWAQGEIGPARLAVMERAPTPKCAVLGRIKDRAAGVGFVGAHDGVAMLHGFFILPALRRRGLGRWMLREAAFWAEAQGAETLALQVTRANAGAIRLYQGAGMQQVAAYHYRIAPGATA